VLCTKTIQRYTQTDGQSKVVLIYPTVLSSLNNDLYISPGLPENTELENDGPHRKAEKNWYKFYR